MDAGGYLERRDGYRDYLARMLAFHRALRVSGPGADAFAEWGIPNRVTWLENDLRDVAHAADVPRGVLARVPNLRDDLAEAVGALYVLVGSGLGACIIARRVERFGLPAGQGRAYLDGLCRTTDWPGFLAFLEHVPLANEERLLVGAKAMFEGIHETLACRVPA
jgi:heme oxygenase